LMDEFQMFLLQPFCLKPFSIKAIQVFHCCSTNKIYSFKLL
jgi:hypothetical protein